MIYDGTLGTKEFRKSANAKEWRLFMSSRVSDTLREAAPQRFSRNDSDKLLEQQEFKKIYKEVEQLGTSQMSWKQRKAMEEKKMFLLGAKPEKGHKMPIAMGMNIKRKREKLEEKKLQEDIALGLRSAKREKRMAERLSTTDRGLKVSDGIFKGGVLYVKPMKQAKNEVPDKLPDGGRWKGNRKSGKKGKKKGKHTGKRKRR